MEVRGVCPDSVKKKLTPRNEENARSSRLRSEHDNFSSHLEISCFEPLPHLRPFKRPLYEILRIQVEPHGRSRSGSRRCSFYRLSDSSRFIRRLDRLLLLLLLRLLLLLHPVQLLHMLLPLLVLPLLMLPLLLMVALLLLRLLLRHLLLSLLLRLLLLLLLRCGMLLPLSLRLHLRSHGLRALVLLIKLKPTSLLLLKKLLLLLLLLLFLLFLRGRGHPQLAVSQLLLLLLLLMLRLLLSMALTILSLLTHHVLQQTEPKATTGAGS